MGIEGKQGEKFKDKAGDRCSGLYSLHIAVFLIVYSPMSVRILVTTHQQ